MTRDDPDAIVVGAGPAGAIAARELARRGRRVVLLEARHMPRPKICAGGISPWARSLLRKLDLWDRVEAEAYEVRGIRLTAPSGAQTVWVGAASASVLERSRLDHLLARSAVEAGATLLEGRRARELFVERGRTRGVRLTTGEVLHSRWVIAATGASGKLDTDPRPRRLLSTCMARFEGITFTPHVLEFYFDEGIAPHYGWLFPESDTRANVGLCIDADRSANLTARETFARFLDRRFSSRCAGARTVDPWRGFPISVTGRIRHHAPPGTLLAGEACRLANPATGEGICYAIGSGALAARLVDRALRHRTDPHRVAGLYARQLRLRYEPSMHAGSLFLRLGMPLVGTTVALGRNRWLRGKLGQQA